ncbi:MAG: hypothetical protein ACJ8M4_11995 [Chthoniobacterales bacterium]
MILLQAVMTDYELGLMKVIPITMHLMADYVIGAVLLSAPFPVRNLEPLHERDPPLDCDGNCHVRGRVHDPAARPRHVR